MKILIALTLYSTFTDLLGYSSIAPFFPPQLQERGLSPLYNSIVFAVYAFSYVGCSLVISNVLIPRFGRPLPFFFGALSQLFSMLMLCSLQYIHSNTLFLTVAVGARILQGAGSSLMITICFALAALAYP